MKATKAAGDQRRTEQRAKAERGGEAIGAAMVDALEDILAWEKASERSLKAAAPVADADLSN